MLDSDLYYLEDKELVRQLIGLGYHGKGEILTREQFQTLMQSMEDAIRNKNANQAKVGLPLNLESGVGGVQVRRLAVPDCPR